MSEAIATCPHLLPADTCTVCSDHAERTTASADDALQSRIVTIDLPLAVADREGAPTGKDVSTTATLRPYLHVTSSGKSKGTRVALARAEHAKSDAALKRYASHGLDLPGIAVSAPTFAFTIADDVSDHADVSGSVTLAPTKSGKSLTGSERVQHAGEWLAVDVTARPWSKGNGTDREHGWNIRAVARTSSAPREDDAPEIDTRVTDLASLA